MLAQIFFPSYIMTFISNAVRLAQRTLILRFDTSIPRCQPFSIGDL